MSDPVNASTLRSRARRERIRLAQLAPQVVQAAQPGAALLDPVIPTGIIQSH